MEEDLETLPAFKNDDAKAQNIPFFPKEEEMNEEEFDRMMEEVYNRAPGLGAFAEENYENKNSTGRNPPTQSARDTSSLWKVKCMVRLINGNKCFSQELSIQFSFPSFLTPYIDSYCLEILFVGRAWAAINFLSYAEICWFALIWYQATDKICVLCGACKRFYLHWSSKAVWFNWGNLRFSGNASIIIVVSDKYNIWWVTLDPGM